MAAAIRASVATQQEEIRRSEDREEGGRPKKEEAAARGPDEPRGPRRLTRAQGEGPGKPGLPVGRPSPRKGVGSSWPAWSPGLSGPFPVGWVSILCSPVPSRPSLHPDLVSFHVS